MVTSGAGAADFDMFYGATAQRVTKAMFVLTGDLAEAEDVTQEAFERAWLRWPAVADSASPEAWVRTVARRLAVSRWRRARNASLAWVRRGAAEHEPGLGPQHVALVAALSKLPAHQRVAIVLHHLVDLPVEQVALETGASVSAVKQRLARGRAAMAVSLADEPGRLWQQVPAPKESM